MPLKITKQVNCDACTIKRKHMSYKLLTQQKGGGASWDEEWQGVKSHGMIKGMTHF